MFSCKKDDDAPTDTNTNTNQGLILNQKIQVDGTEDPIIPYTGGQVAGDGGLVKSAQETVDYWVNRNGTSGTPVETNIPNSNQNDDCSAVKYLYKNGTNNTEVALYKINNGGHTSPSISERYNSIYLSIVGNQKKSILKNFTSSKF